MKQYFDRQNKRNKYFAYGVLALIAVMFILTGGIGIMAGVTVAMAGIALTDEETAFLAEVKGAINKEVEKFGKGYITETKLTEFVEAKMKEVREAGIKQEDFDTLKSTVEALGLEFKKYKSKGDEQPKTMKEQIAANLEAIKKAVSNKSVADFVVKANVTRASVADSTQGLRLQDIGQLAHRKLVAYDRFTKVPVGPDSNGVVRYADWDDATKVRAAAMVAEEAEFLESTAAWAEYSLDLKKIGDSIPVTEETLYDASRFAAELESFLQTNVALIEDTQLTTGTGIGTNLTGYYTRANTYAAAAAGIADANIYDLIVKMVESMTSAAGSKYAPDTVFMNIADINKMKLKKDANNNYIMPPFVTDGGKNIDGMVVLETNAITANTMVVADARFGKIYEVEGYNVQTGWVNDQFTKDLMTMKATKREALLIREADKGAFLKCTDISAALVTLAT